MLNAAQAIRAHTFAATLVFCCVGFLAPMSSVAQPPDGVVPITSEPDHKIRFDNGRVRMIEAVFPKGKASLYHEHRFDAFFVFFRTADVTDQPFGEKSAASRIRAGSVFFKSTEKGPYSHRVIAAGDETVHVIATELMAPAGSASASESRFPPFEVALENPRGRVYRLKLNPGESAEVFTRPAGTAIFAISSGRISEKPEGEPARLWDFEPGRFRWVETREELSLKNESPAPIELVEIEVF
jgi:hypothetical protein